MIIKTGDRFIATIKGIFTTGLIYISDDSDGKMYLCQNVRNGATSPDTLGFYYSWICSINSKDHELYDVADFKIINEISLEDKEICRDWGEGDILINENKSMKILFRFKDFVVCQTAEYYLSPEIYDINLLVLSGWRCKEVRNNEKRKLTINELIEMAGLDPDEIQII